MIQQGVDFSPHIAGDVLISPSTLHPFPIAKLGCPQAASKRLGIWDVYDLSSFKRVEDAVN